MIMVVIRIENKNVIPIQQRHVEFKTVEELLLYLTNVSTAIEVSISSIEKMDDPLWILHVKSSPKFIEMCHADGICGTCWGIVDPKKPMPQYNVDEDTIGSKWVHCASCGRRLGTMKEHSIIDIFYQSSQRINIEHPFTPIPFTCGTCQGTGTVETWDDDGIPTRIFHDPCPTCHGKRMIKIEKDIALV